MAFQSFIDQYLLITFYFGHVFEIFFQKHELERIVEFLSVVCGVKEVYLR